MKKFATVILVLVLSIMITSAFAEEKTFGMAAITDLEGNVLYAVLEDNSIVDADGNAVDSIPYYTMNIDDEAMTFRMGVSDKTLDGTVEILESTDTQVNLKLTLTESGVVILAAYTTEGGSMLTIIDEANSILVLLTEEVAA